MLNAKQRNAWQMRNATQWMSGKETKRDKIKPSASHVILLCYATLRFYYYYYYITYVRTCVTCVSSQPSVDLLLLLLLLAVLWNEWVSKQSGIGPVQSSPIQSELRKLRWLMRDPFPLRDVRPLRPLDLQDLEHWLAGCICSSHSFIWFLFQGFPMHTTTRVEVVCIG